jgi:hypothetical protein
MLCLQPQEARDAPENTRLPGGGAQLELLLASRLKTLEGEAAELRRELDEAKEQEVVDRILHQLHLHSYHHHHYFIINY